jgi:beta-xylosidase
MGSYKKPATPLLKTKEGETYSPGHQCVLQLRSGEWWMAYHAWDAQKEPRYGQNPNGRTLRLDRLKWTPRGPTCEGPSLGPQSFPKP